MSKEKKAELSVWGWIRENYTNLSEIPTELIQLCLFMYFIKMDSWSKDSSDPTFIIDEQTISLDREQNYPNAFGDLVFRKGDMM